MARSITIEGQAHELAPLTLAAIRKIREASKVDLLKMSGTDLQNDKFLEQVAFHSLGRRFTIEQISDSMTVSDVSEVIGFIAEQSEAIAASLMERGKAAEKAREADPLAHSSAVPQ